MSFVDEFNQFRPGEILERARAAGKQGVENALRKSRPGLEDFAALISEQGSLALATLSQRSQRLTQQRFGKVIRLFAPLYISNECINNCKYCGFSRDNPILRVTLSLEEVEQEGAALYEQGFRNILLVAGEHPKFVAQDYLVDCVKLLHAKFPSVSLEVGPMETPEYARMVRAGADGLVVYQETYNRNAYEEVHTAGPKRNFDWRLETPERAYAAGFRRLGIGALYGLADWREEALCVAAHAEYLLRRCWKAQLTISLPRLRPHAGEFTPRTQISDRELVQLVCALRLTFPDAGLVLSTRESPRLRDGLFPLGITMISAGSHTEPGGYTGAGKEQLHYTERGKIVPLAEGPARATHATGQFDIADDRTAEMVAKRIQGMGYEPVWKDWDSCLISE